jgi:membrane fusion protein (multidrug efflux system)
VNKSVSASEIEGSYKVVSSQITPASSKRNKLRKILLLGLAGKVLFLGAAYFGYEEFFGARYVETDNAYVSAETAAVTPQVAGPVKEIRVSDTDSVRAGDVLVVLDDTDARLALAQAEASLGQAERRVRGYFANDEGLSAQVTAREAEQFRAAAQMAGAEADLERARVDLQRREALAASGSVSGDELTRARNAFMQAQASLDSARANQAQTAATHAAALGALKANFVLTANTTVDTNPEVAAARARLEQARVDLSRTVIRAPVDGVIVRRDVQVGQRVQPGTPLMSVVPIAHAYVDANFKEGQLSKVHTGQKVELISDLYGSGVTFHGEVVGLSGGTGSSFALIPAQNATGNWIKVVQRLPVRVALDPSDLKAHPLRVGLTMTATIDTQS